LLGFRCAGEGQAAALAKAILDPAGGFAAKHF